MENFKFILLVSAVGLLLFLLVCREVFCWYWKTTQILEQLERSNRFLEKIANHFDSSAKDEKAQSEGQG
jgi:hypothetical protein